MRLSLMQKTLAAASILLGIIMLGIQPYIEANAKKPIQSSKHQPDEFHFIWQEVESASAPSKAGVNQSDKIQLLRNTAERSDPAAEAKLLDQYGISLSDTNSHWTAIYATQLLKELQKISRSAPQIANLLNSHWILTTSYIEDDIQILKQAKIKTVVISTAVFNRAGNQFGFFNNQAGTFISKRLHQSLIRYVTDNGSNLQLADQILRQRFGVSIIIEDYEQITRGVTAEAANRFQRFHSSEIIELINMFEQMPETMHKVDGLRYLLRRLDGTPHPKYPTAPAVAWVSHGYIEFMEIAFTGTHINHLKRLIIHEKAHFLWQYLFDEKLKSDWIDIGQWTKDATSNAWRTSLQTEFVSAYAHGLNPNEDMAESISYYILSPDLFRSRAIDKYNFIRDRIMEGDLFISKIREDLNYEVKNLSPDYVYPGKIKAIEVKVMGTKTEDKKIQLDLVLHGEETKSKANKTSNNTAAASARLRIMSDYNTFFDARLVPIDQDGKPTRLSHHLRAQVDVSRFVRKGYWSTNQIVITDQVGNQRFEQAEDFGWMLFINNPLQDLDPPNYVKKSARLIKTLKNYNGQAVQTITARWQVQEAIEMGGFECYATLNDEFLGTYKQEKYGKYDANTRRCEVDFPMPDYMPDGTYSLAFLRMSDAALNVRGVYFSTPGDNAQNRDRVQDEAHPQITIKTKNPDFEAPTLDLDNIIITSESTQPNNPNGETKVTVTFKVKDDNAGLDIAAMYMRDPQGIVHFSDYVSLNDATDQNSVGRREAWRTMTKTIILPPGSAPGTWGLSEMTVRDKAGNFKTHDFTEIIHFDVE